jgi:hypothetical protein
VRFPVVSEAGEGVDAGEAHRRIVVAEQLGGAGVAVGEGLVLLTALLAVGGGESDGGAEAGDDGKADLDGVEEVSDVEYDLDRASIDGRSPWTPRGRLRANHHGPDGSGTSHRHISHLGSGTAPAVGDKRAADVGRARDAVAEQAVGGGVADAGDRDQGGASVASGEGEHPAASA